VGVGGWEGAGDAGGDRERFCVSLVWERLV